MSLDDIQAARNEAVLDLALKWRGADPKPARVDLVELLRLHRTGLSQPQIARELGCNPGTVSRALKRAGVPARSADDYLRRPSALEIRALYEQQGLGVHAVASRLGISTGRLSRLMREYKIPARRAGRPDGPNGPTLQVSLKRMRPLLRERSGGICEVRCSNDCRGTASHTHHRKLRKHGDHSLANLLHVCIVCHGVIHKAERIDPFEYGWLLRSWDDPERISWRPYEDAA